jgi:hypothetical protein
MPCIRDKSPLAPLLQRGVGGGFLGFRLPFRGLFFCAKSRKKPRIYSLPSQQYRKMARASTTPTPT